ncbi:hypothetical protein [Streptomyces griseoaurantiacus]|uniref:hypothetical protein n=1 Tax=Streptomyces griseoaurantiacus TaxID=68213 RepID=UPI0036B98506
MSDATTYGTYDPADRPGRREAEPEAPASGLKAEDGTELPGFDERYSEPLQGLLYIGALTDRFSWLGHEFVIRTLGVDEQLAVGQVIKPYEETGAAGAQLAYATAIAAMSVVSVDGEELPSPIGEDQKLAEWAHKRFAYVKANWFSYTIQEVFQRYMLLEDVAAKTVDAMGKAFGPAA